MPRARTRRATPPATAPDPRLAPVALELERWRVRAVPDPVAPLDADDVARLVRDCYASLGIDPAAGEGFSVNTVHYYRRKDILDEPDGRTSAARYALRHVWQAAGARLAGHLGLVTLAEARDQIRGANEQTLIEFLAARVADARGRLAARPAPIASAPAARPLVATQPYAYPTSQQLMATIVPLGGNALCLIPATHAALHSPAAARDLVEALASALGVTS